MRRAFCILLALTGTIGCDDGFDASEVPDGPLVESEIVHVVPDTMRTGSFVLTLFVGPDEDSADVWLHSIGHEMQSGAGATVETAVSFPVEVEPNELVRVPFTYDLGFEECEHRLLGTIYDTLSEELSEVSSPAARATRCN